MSKISDLLKGLTQKELRKLLSEIPKILKKPIIRKKPRKIPVSRNKLTQLYRQGITRKEMARQLKVSERTIYRRLNEYKIREIREIPIKPEWILTKDYITDLKRAKRIRWAQTPIKKYISTKDLICSNKQSYPKGKYFAFSLYFIVNYDGKRMIFMRALQYKEKNVKFDEIKEFTLRNAYEIITKMFRRAPFYVEEIIAYEFLTKKEYSAFPPQYKGGKEES